MPSARLPRVLRSKVNVSRNLIPILALFFLYRFLTSWGEPVVVPIYPHENKSFPPLYPALLDRERRLPQHRVDLPFPEGKGGACLSCTSMLKVRRVVCSAFIVRYLWVRREIFKVWQSAVGVSNALSSCLAHLTKTSLVWVSTINCRKRTL